MTISGFQGENRFLSNFWPCVMPVRLKDCDLDFFTVEAAYVAAKTTDYNIRKAVANLLTPGDCKRFGKGIQLRYDWEVVKRDIMHDLVWQKFSKNPELKEKLLATGDQELIETNKWGDVYWGVCNGKGQNHLGKILMKVRRELLWQKEHSLVIMERHMVFVNTDPQRRCYDGCYFSYEYHWSGWTELERIRPGEEERRLQFWRELNDDAVKARGKGAKREFKVQPKEAA